MIYYYDLHIHSVLSPCADCLMTPNNIFNMAKLKGLDVIAVTDHNSLKQLPALYELSKSYDMLFIPGVELTLSEGFDVLIYFKNINDALSFDTYLENNLVLIKLDEAYYGHQEIMDVNDELIDTFPYLLIKPTRISIHTLMTILKPYETIVVIPHLIRQPQTHLSLLKHITIDAIEGEDLLDLFPIERLHNSDAHQITDILERTLKNTIDLPELTIDAFFNYFKHG